MIHPDSPFVSTVRVNRARMGLFDRVLAISAHIHSSGSMHKVMQSDANSVHTMIHTDSPGFTLLSTVRVISARMGLFDHVLACFGHICSRTLIRIGAQSVHRGATLCGEMCAPRCQSESL